MRPAAPPPPPFVAIVDDDAGVRAALDSLFRSIGLATRLFGSPAELLQAALPDAPGCLVLDVRLPGSSGLDVQASLAGHGIDLPVVFMTGHGDIPMTVQAMKAGACPTPRRAISTCEDTARRALMAHGRGLQSRTR